MKPEYSTQAWMLSAPGKDSKQAQILITGIEGDRPPFIKLEIYCLLSLFIIPNACLAFLPFQVSIARLLIILLPEI